MIELSSGALELRKCISFSEEELRELISNPHFRVVSLMQDTYGKDPINYDLDDETIEQLNIIFRERKDVLFDFFIPRTDLLKYTPTVERVKLHVGGYETTQDQFNASIEHLSCLDNVIEINLPDVKKRIDVSGLIKFSSKLESLGVVGNYKNVDQLIQSANVLKTLRLTSVKLNDLSCLENIELTSFSNFGPKILDYSYLGNMTSLKKLRITRDRKTESLQFVSKLQNLEMIVIDEMQKLKECPEFQQNKNLRTFSAVFCPAIEENQAYVSWAEQNPPNVDDVLYG